MTQRSSCLRIINARLPDSDATAMATLCIQDGRFTTDVPDDSPVLNVKGQLVLPGLIETHLHLDKACIMHRCRLVEGVS